MIYRELLPYEVDKIREISAHSVLSLVETHRAYRACESFILLEKAIEYAALFNTSLRHASAAVADPITYA